MSRVEKKRYSDNEKMSLVAAFEKSNESAISFCNSNKLSPSTFCTWRKKLKVRGEVASSFIEVPIAMQPLSPMAGIHCGFFSLSAPETLSTEELTKILYTLQAVSQ